MMAELEPEVGAEELRLRCLKRSDTRMIVHDMSTTICCRLHYLCAIHNLQINILLYIIGCK